MFMKSIRWLIGSVVQSSEPVVFTWTGRCTDRGRRFHTSGPAIEKAGLPDIVLEHGMMRSDLAADRSCYIL